ncbi:MAG: hypothetical protein CMP76_12255 [Flavobacterium sp.]|nr:hypothetical protein [Flavobacterium sp.]|tara:strand:+ start:865 stop:1089 length:225 start_codon:yes stop_codon:yes gene_type:complete
MKIFFAILLFLLLLVAIPFVSAVLIITSPFILIYKIKVLNKPKSIQNKSKLPTLTNVFQQSNNFLKNNQNEPIK